MLRPDLHQAYALTCVRLRWPAIARGLSDSYSAPPPDHLPGSGMPGFVLRNAEIRAGCELQDTCIAFLHARLSSRERFLGSIACPAVRDDRRGLRRPRI